MDIEATREGETLPKLDQVDQVDIEATREGEILPKLDQVDQEEGGDTDDKGKEQVQVQGHRCHTNEELVERSGGRRRYNENDCLQVETEGVMRITQQDRKNFQEGVNKLDQVDQVEGGDPHDKGKGETSNENNDTEEINQVWGINVTKQEKHDIHQAKTEGTEYQAKGDVKSESIGNSQLEDKQREAITKRPPRHRGKTKGREEATSNVKWCKGPVITYRRGKKKKNSNKNSDTEAEEEISQDQVQVQARIRYANLDDEGRGRQVPGRDDREDMDKAGGAGLDDTLEGEGVGLDDMLKGKKEGLDNMFKGEKAGLDDIMEGVDTGRQEQGQGSEGTASEGEGAGRHELSKAKSCSGKGVFYFFGLRIHYWGHWVKIDIWMVNLVGISLKY